MTREAEERGKRVRGDLVQLPSQQAQTLGTIDARKYAMMERRTQGIMDRLDALLGNRSGSGNRGAHSREANREPRVNFNEHPMGGKTYGFTKERCKSLVTPLGITGRGIPRISEEALLAVGRSRTKDLREMHMRVEKVMHMRVE